MTRGLDVNMGSDPRAKAISPRTIELIESFAASPGLFPRLFGRRAAPSPTVLDEIVSSGEIEAALALLSLAMAGSPPYSAPLRDAVERIVRSAPVSALVWLEQRARVISEWRREGWAWSRDVTPERVRNLPAQAASVAGVASLHNDGYVREAAVDVLSASDDPVALPFLLIRANDWVAPVRVKAVRGIEEHVARGGGGPFVPYLELVDRLKRARRSNLKPLADTIIDALAASTAATALQAGCSSGSRLVRRRCFELAFSARTFELSDLVSRGLQDPDNVVRALTAKGAVKALDWEHLERLLDPMLASGTPAVRYSALEALWTRSGAESRPVQERFALDPHPHVRGTARWFLKSLRGFDSAAFYRRALASVTDGPELAGALEGLGEVGTTEDAALVVPFLNHARARIRTAAVHALGSTGSAAEREAIIGALSDPSSRVCRAARRILLRGPPVDPDRLTFAALKSRYPHERRAAIELAGAHDYWIAAILLLRILESPDPDTQARAITALRAWASRYNQVFTRPTRAQVDEFESLVESAHLDGALRSWLRALVPALRLRYT